METFISVLDILVSGSFMNIGDIVRCERICTKCLYLVRNHNIMWNAISKKHNLKCFSYQDCIKTILRDKRCRECGTFKSKHLSTRRNNTIYVCEDCFACEKNYSHLLSRIDIYKSLFRSRKRHPVLWSHKIQLTFDGLHIALRGRHNTYYYWAFQWKSPLRGFFSR